MIPVSAHPEIHKEILSGEEGEEHKRNGWRSEKSERSARTMLQIGMQLLPLPSRVESQILLRVPRQLTSIRKISSRPGSFDIPRVALLRLFLRFSRNAPNFTLASHFVVDISSSSFAPRIVLARGAKLVARSQGDRNEITRELVSDRSAGT